jgi:hypothetical protein
MTAWWEKPYAGGPMAVPAAYFPRPLYPPDSAPGRMPSKDGPDALAYKRTLCRLGRWGEWEPSKWDDSFSNGFSHGKGPNVADSGIAGFQRQMGIDPTGFIGAKTFNTLASCRVPDDPAFPHAGEMAMDARSVELIMEAFKVYGGQATPPAPTPPPPTGNKRQVALDHMQRRLGYTESPADSNCDDRPDGIRTAQDHCAAGTWLRGEPWCGCWCFYALESAGVAKIDYHLASVAQIEDYARAAQKCYRGWTTDSSKVKIGDLVVVGGRGVHVEMVRGTATPSSVPTYGGNTSSGTAGSQSNGGGAYARTRYASEVHGYALVRYPGE